MKTFNDVYSTHKENLELYVPVVARVHGPSHPVFYDVQKNYDELITNIQNNKLEELKSIFENLRKITDNYIIPADTCETYEAVYKMLEALDVAYSQSL